MFLLVTKTETVPVLQPALPAPIVPEIPERMAKKEKNSEKTVRCAVLYVVLFCGALFVVLFI